MINKENLKDFLKSLGFSESKGIYFKLFKEIDATLKVNFNKEELIYPENKGFVITERQTCNFKSNENFVVFECVHRLFEKGYKPEHIELEPKWKVGHGASGGRADILIKDNLGKSLLIIECKTEGKEHNDAWKKMLQNGGQLFSYVQQSRSTQFVCLYSSDYIDGKVVYKNQIVTLRDNEKFLEENKDKKLLSYKDAQEVEDIFRTWKETYKQDFATRGIFESDIQPYYIGKNKFSLNDLKDINSKDIQGKYHEFATILRQHNVSGRENAFDKLVNLFLCKIVDEAQNPEELKFYWKGIAYDSYFDLQDRLQQLYQSGMKEFLGEDVTYIDNSAIDEAFRFFKNDPDATRNTIKKYFRELKFFTNNDFAFIDVHNENLFYQNAAVLLKIVQMLQDIRLKTDEPNQFLGDMFEGFLDQGIKQSEGQFFTPMPIVKFILSSLPLENIIKGNEQIPKAIDYACGAGHFLNEYALQIASYVANHKKTDITEYYPEIIGIEKEYRLSKVAKVSAFMYGQDDIKIIYSDALAENPTLKDNQFSVLVSNPPYSVKGFLETLSYNDCKKFELIDTIDEKSFSNNNSIEAFFIERAKQLLKTGGVAAIIVPSSILSKGTNKNTSKKKNLYVATREILLKYFDIVAIAEFGSGTFSKTGTNTVALFMKRKKENPSPSEHYKNRVSAWFKNDISKDDIFSDEYFIKKYCNLLNYSFEDYKTLLEGSPNENILNADVFKEYRKDFDSSSEIKNRKNQHTFKILMKEDQKVELDKKFFEYIKNIESDKLYYFILASSNSNEVVIVKTPTDNNSKKKFLGYEWSSAKGNEGIKYLGSEIVATSAIETDDNEADTSLEEDDVRVLSNILNLNNIQTPLYDPKNLENAEKINSIIKANFNGETIVIPEQLKEYVTTSKLVDMLDLSRKEFNKSISLSPKKNIVLETKWELVKLGDITEIIAGQSPKSVNYNESGNGLPFYQGKKDFGTLFLNKPTVWTTEVTKESIKGDLLMSVRAPVGSVNFNPYVKICIGRGLAAIRSSNKELLKYLFEFIISHQYLFSGYHGATFESISTADLRDIKIPLPPPEVQKQVVQECKIVDREFEEAIREIDEAKKTIEFKVTEVFDKGYQLKKLSDISIINPSKTEIQSVEGNTVVSFIEMSSVNENGFISYKEDRLLKDLKNGSYTYFKENDIIIAKITPCMENGKCAIATGLTNGIGMGSSEFHVIRVDEKNVLTKYIFALLNRDIVRKEAKTKMTGSSGHRRVPATYYESFQIPIPEIKIQNTIIKEIEQQENKIKMSQEVIYSMAERKQKVIKKYL